MVFFIRIILYLLMRIKFVDNIQVCHKRSECIIFLLDAVVGSVFLSYNINNKRTLNRLGKHYIYNCSILIKEISGSIYMSYKCRIPNQVCLL